MSHEAHLEKLAPRTPIHNPVAPFARGLKVLKFSGILGCLWFSSATVALSTMEALSTRGRR